MDIEQKYGSILTALARKYLSSCNEDFSLPHFDILWKIHKNPTVGRPIVASYKWRMTCASKIVNFYLNGCVSKFATILPNTFLLTIPPRFTEGFLLCTLTQNQI